MSKITIKDFIKHKSAILKKIETYKQKVHIKEYVPIHNKFILDNCNYLIGKVYEIEKGKNRRGFNRFVIYSLQVTTIDKTFAFIHALGWWLDVDNNPIKWDDIIVFGANNSSILKLSKNQKHNKREKL